LPTRENKFRFPFLFAEQTEVAVFREFLFLSMYILYTENETIHIYINAAVPDGKRKTKAQGIFVNLFTVCSSSNRKFVFYLFLGEETTEVTRLQTD
jgi:hypothetical protein